MLKPPFRLWATLVILAFVSHNQLFAQNQTNNFGKEFRFAFLENYSIYEKVSFVVHSENPNFILRIFCGIYSDTFIVKQKDTILTYTKLGVPSSTVFTPARSILITASANISVYAMNNSLNSTDISNITPSEKIPGNPVYYINSFRGDESLGKANNSLFTVVAVDDSCLINILPSCDSKNNLVKNTLYQVLLRKGQIYQEQASDSQSFAGTKIWNTKDCKRFSVFEGAKCSYVAYNNSNCKGCDHLYNQSRPTQFLGKKFTTIPFAGNTGGYLYQIVATENGTNISINNTPTVSLNEGQVYTVNQNVNLSICISSNKNISVIELMKSGECNGNASLLGNPSLMSVLPDDQMSQDAGFSFPFTSNISQNPSFPAEFYVAIVANNGQLGQLKINGNFLDTNLFTSSCDVKVGTFKLNPALSYQIDSKYGFLAYMYAFGKDESYATPVASAFETNKVNLNINSNLTDVCDSNHQFIFTAKSDSVATYQWKFGDGSTQSGDSVLKVYNKIGKFNMKLLINYPNSGSCQIDSISKEINVYRRPYFKIGKDTSMCKGNFFELSPLTPQKVTYLWSTGSKSNTLYIDSDKEVWLELTDTNFCKFKDSINITFINCDTSNIVIPNVFTPGSINGGTAVKDNVNDFFETRFSGFDELSGTIFNRWGTVVYKFNFPSDEYWNGSINNDESQPCAGGTYYYIYTFKNLTSGLERTVNGVVYLIR